MRRDAVACPRGISVNGKVLLLIKREFLLTALRRQALDRGLIMKLFF